MSQKNYLETVYNESSKPLTDYPKRLINYLIKRLNLEKNRKF